MKRAAFAHTLAAVGLTAMASLLFAAGVDGTNQLQWGLPIAVFVVVTLVVGWLLAWRRPGIALGWTLLAIALFIALQGPTGSIGVALASRAPGAATWLLWFGGDNQWSWIPAVGLLVTQVPLRFPDGRLPSRSWRWFSRCTVAALVLASLIGMTEGVSVGGGLANPTYVDLGAATEPIDFVGVAVLIPALIGSVASLVPRYRRADAVERAQLRWVFSAVAVAVGLLILGWLVTFALGASPDPRLPEQATIIVDAVTGFGYSLIPLAILFAVLRYGLYSIDRIISRTAAYGIVTLATVVVYSGMVVLVSILLPGTESVGVAVATLVAAAVFLPLLRWVRRAVDRRFDRAEYDARKVVEGFGSRVRNGADPSRAGSDLIAAVGRALQPSAIGLWVRGDGG